MGEESSDKRIQYLQHLHDELSKKIDVYVQQIIEERDEGKSKTIYALVKEMKAEKKEYEDKIENLLEGESCSIFVQYLIELFCSLSTIRSLTSAGTLEVAKLKSRMDAMELKLDNGMRAIVELIQ